MKILGIHPGHHDSAVAAFNDYTLVAAVQLERLTRRKGDGHGIPEAAIAEALTIAGWTAQEVDAVAFTRTAFPWGFYSHFSPWRRFKDSIRGRTDRLRTVTTELRRAGRSDAEGILDHNAIRAALGLRPDCRLYFANHHNSHALASLFFTDWEDALLYTADGGGDEVQYSHRLLRGGALETFYGDDRWLKGPTRIDSLGLAYGYATAALGFKMLRHEGKLTGLAAYGEPSLLPAMAAHFRVDEDGQIHSDYSDYKAMRAHIEHLAQGAKREDVAASIQALLENTIFDSVQRLIHKTGSRKLGLAGGVFANVRLNRVLAEGLPLDEVFIFPAMGDEGLPVGAALEFLMQRDGLGAWLERRTRLPDLYLGRDHGAEADAILSQGARAVPGDPVAEAVERMANGEAGAIYTARMEYGPRALGARSIIASPADRGVNDRLNARLERTEFMPFAPVVLEEDADTVFEVTPANRYACRFMTITTGVKPEWIEKIPAVVHVDNTARPQVISQASNPLYHALLTGFKAKTGLPVLINTSFNVHEEPIVNTPQECLRALTDRRVDFVVTPKAVYVPT